MSAQEDAMLVRPDNPDSLPRTLPAKSFAGKPKQTEREALRWVLDTLALDKVNTEDCPSAKAWFFFWQACTTPKFAAQLALKFVPSQTDLTAHEALADDGRDVRDRLAAIRQRARELGAKEAPRRGPPECPGSQVVGLS
jgi:hypothetical protein